MSKVKLQKHLEDLKKETNKLSDVHSATKEKMSVLISQIEHLLEHPDDAEHRGRVIDALKNQIESFEVKHPDLTGVLNQIMVMLGNMGI